MKKISALLLCAVMIAAMCACGKKENGPGQSGTNEPSSAEAPSPTEALDESKAMEVLSIDGTRLGLLPANSNPTVTDRGIFYSVEPEFGVGDTDYRIFDPETGKDVKIGTVENESYETAYCRVELEGKLYTAVMTGNLFDSEPDPLWLAEFDIVNGGVRLYKVSDNGFPYTSVAAVNGSIYLIDHDQREDLHDGIMRFDPATGELTEAAAYELKGDSSRGDTARYVCESDGKLCVLRVRFENGEPGLYIDFYGSDNAKESERDITAVAKQAVELVLTPADVETELMQPVSAFAVNNGTVFYANFSATHFLAELETGRLLREVTELFNRSQGSGKAFYYQIFETDGNGNSIYELSGSSLSASRFDALEEDYYIVSASAAPNGDRLIVTSSQAANEKPVKLYYLKG